MMMKSAAGFNMVNSILKMTAEQEEEERTKNERIDSTTKKFYTTIMCFESVMEHCPDLDLCRRNSHRDSTIIIETILFIIKPTISTPMQQSHKQSAWMFTLTV